MIRRLLIDWIAPLACLAGIVLFLPAIWHATQPAPQPRLGAEVRLAPLPTSPPVTNELDTPGQYAATHPQP